MIFKHFPMDKACNPELKKTLHPAACAAAVATEIVLKEQGNEAFWRMHDLLFEDRERITAEYLFEVSEQVGVEEETVKSLLNTTSIWDRIKADVAQGRELGLTGTPALFLDGRRMKSWGDRHFWRHYVEHAEPSSATQPATSTAPASPLEEIDEEVAGTN
jgi:2-hydroxychromene-2-carboxylate isomerase